MSTTSPSHTSRLTRINRELSALEDAFAATVVAPFTTDTAAAARATQLALIAARRAGWWRVLIRTLREDRMSPGVFHTAAIEAAHASRKHARFWRDSAADWRARAEQRPTSDVAGAMSNHHDLGIAS